jgi:hypothetical protein
MWTFSNRFPAKKNEKPNTASIPQRFHPARNFAHNGGIAGRTDGGISNDHIGIPTNEDGKGIE